MDHEFLKEKYNLHNAPEVEQSARRTEKRTGEKVPQSSDARIENYLDRFREIIERKDPEKGERGMEALKRVLYDKFVIRPEEIPESYFENQRRLVREQGHGHVEIAPDVRQELSDIIVADQKGTLDNWLDYLASPDAMYPLWLKYWAMRSVLGMGGNDKERKVFSKRSTGTTTPFPDLNREALAYVLDAVQQKYGKQHVRLLALEGGERKEFEKLLEAENFPKLYTWALEKIAMAPEGEELANTSGKWVKYNKDSDPLPLVQSIRSYGTGWCMAGEAVAESYLRAGDFYVYYSKDKKGHPVVPRAAIQMNGDQIGQVKGIAVEQNLDPYIVPVVETKLGEFPDGKAYEKKTQDMKTLTAIERKLKAGEKLVKDDLVFLYELNQPIEGFGYQRDPRIGEIRSQRNPEDDMLILFECGESQIARKVKDIKEGAKAYVGTLVPGIFDKIQECGIEHVYTSFPEGRIRKETIEIGGKGAKTPIKEMREQDINISNYAMDMLESKDFKVMEETEDAVLVRLKVRDLGIKKDYSTTDDIYKRIEELGLELCPAEVGPQYRLQYQNQPMGEWLYIGMKQIAVRGGGSSVFRLGRGGGGLWLDRGWASPGRGWSPGDGFVFRLRKLKNLKT